MSNEQRNSFQDPATGTYRRGINRSELFKRMSKSYKEHQDDIVLLNKEAAQAAYEEIVKILGMVDPVVGHLEVDLRDKPDSSEFQNYLMDFIRNDGFIVTNISNANTRKIRIDWTKL